MGFSPLRDALSKLRSMKHTLSRNAGCSGRHASLFAQFSQERVGWKRRLIAEESKQCIFCFTRCRGNS